MTNKDIERLLVFFDDNGMTWDEYASLKVKLEGELEKAKKYDDLMKANSEIVQNNISHTQILQENKQLKNKYEIKVKGLQLSYEVLDKEIKSLKEELEQRIKNFEELAVISKELKDKLTMYEVLATSPEEIDRVLDKLTNIKELNDEHLRHFPSSVMAKELKKELSKE